ncbi:MAG TPA: TRAP transporter large permease [bacterium]|nr:TRAP transporter large permease [bacterium]HOL92753.1 TRAP transporter large permease [bacterium]HPO99032.1 TRAP transporter large permease [bacterium]
MLISIAILLFGLFFLLLLLEVPVALALGLPALTAIVLFGLADPILIAQQIFSAFDSYTLLAIPLFLLAGHLLGECALSRRLLDVVLITLGRVRGGVAVVTVVVSLLFAGISGSGPADVAALSVLLFPLLKESGFSEARSGALLAAGGGIGIIVPPSVALILYGVVAETSISQLFLAGVLPGITVSLALIIAVLLLSRRDQIPAHPPRLDWSVAGGSILALLAPVIILGGIYLSIFTPTESAGAAVLYIFLVDWIFYRSLFQEGKLLNVLIRTGRGSAQIFFIIAGGSLFAWVLHQTHLTEDLSGAVLQISQNRIVLLLLINAFLLIAGCFIDAISIIYIFVPVFQPALQQVGVDPVHFGIILTVNMAIGQITPPVGVNLFMASTTTGLNVSQLSRAVIPFLIAEFTALMVITFLPPLSLALPGFMRAK